MLFYVKNWLHWFAQFACKIFLHLIIEADFYFFNIQKDKLCLMASFLAVTSYLCKGKKEAETKVIHSPKGQILIRGN